MAWSGPTSARPRPQAGTAALRRLERLDDGRVRSRPTTTASAAAGRRIIPCNWLQHYENLVDPFHVVILHRAFSGTQFVEQMALMPEVSWDTRRAGVRTHVAAHRSPTADACAAISEAALPTLRVIPEPARRPVRSRRIDRLGPADRRPQLPHLRRRASARERRAGRRCVRDSTASCGRNSARTSTGDFPGDYEAQVSQGAIAMHCRRAPGDLGDRGIVMLRRYMQQQIERMQRGEDPAGVAFGPGAAPVVLRCRQLRRRRLTTRPRIGVAVPYPR